MKRGFFMQWLCLLTSLAGLILMSVSAQAQKVAPETKSTKAIGVVNQSDVIGPLSSAQWTETSCQLQLLDQRLENANRDNILKSGSQVRLAIKQQGRLLELNNVGLGRVVRAASGGRWIVEIAASTRARCMQYEDLHALSMGDLWQTQAYRRVTESAINMHLDLHMQQLKVQGYQVLVPEESLTFARLHGVGFTMDIFPFEWLIADSFLAGFLGIESSVRYNTGADKLRMDDASNYTVTQWEAQIAAKMRLRFFNSRLSTALLLSPLSYGNLEFKLQEKGDYGESLLRGLSTSGITVGGVAQFFPMDGFGLEMGLKKGFIEGKTDPISQSVAFELEKKQVSRGVTAPLPYDRIANESTVRVNSTTRWHASLILPTRVGLYSLRVSGGRTEGRVRLTERNEYPALTNSIVEVAFLLGLAIR